MSQRTIFATLGGILILIAACTPEFAQTTPTIGPVRDGSSRAGFVRMELTSSTNCAESGELVLFTVSIVNETTAPMIITGTPPLDIVLQPAQWPLPSSIPIQRWSQSSQYPAAINPSLAPGEKRTYQWQWNADPIYGQEGVKGIKAKASTALVGAGTTIPQGADVNITVGIGAIPWGNRGEFPCARMRR